MWQVEYMRECERQLVLADQERDRLEMLLIKLAEDDIKRCNRCGKITEYAKWKNNKDEEEECPICSLTQKTEE